MLAEALRNDARRFEKQLESYYLGSDDYDEWSHEATTYLSARFESEEHDIWVDCGKDICLMDVTAPYRAILTEFRPKVAEWEASQPPGFLVSSFFFNNNNGSYRFYFFRDTFDPNALR